MKLILIAAVARNRCIGNQGRLVWSHPEDLARFRGLTLDHTVLMGRTTWESLPAHVRPLPHRTNIVVSRTLMDAPGATLYRHLSQALSDLQRNDSSSVFVVGGAQIYQQTIDHAHYLELTEIQADFDGDAFFPEYHAWNKVHTDPRAGYSFTRYERSTR